MKILGLFLALFVVISGSLFVSSSANAQATRTWVSGVGDDVNPCSRTAPCKTFAGAISKTAINGEINCIDNGGFGAVTITKSITIDCGGVFGSILNAGSNGVIISFDAFAAADVRKSVRLRNLTLNGANTGLIGVRILGNATGALGSEVFIESLIIDGNFGGTARGISDERTGAGELSVSDTIVRNSGATGIAIVTGGARNDVTISNVRVQNSNFGIAISSGAKVMVSDSVFSGNTQAGISSDAGGEMNVVDSVSSSNGLGVQASGTIRLSNTDIAFNSTGISGTPLSFGNNRISGNTAAGTTPTLIGAVSNAFGQQ
jgi:hypothetical protein